MSPTDRLTYCEVMNAACDAMIESSKVMADNRIPLAKRLELRDKLQDRAVKLKDLAMKLAGGDSPEG